MDNTNANLEAAPPASSSPLVIAASYHNTDGNLKISSNGRYLIWYPNGLVGSSAVGTLMLDVKRIKKTSMGKYDAFTVARSWITVGVGERDHQFIFLDALYAQCLDFMPALVGLHCKSAYSINVDRLQSTSLLDLSAELRRIIFKMALQQSEAIVVNPKLKQPALLRTCQIVRSECLSIWYANHYFIHVVDCDARVYLKWQAHLQAVGFWGGGTTFGLTGRPRWAKLMEWCQMVHLKCTDNFYRMVAGTDKYAVAIAGALQIAVESQGLDWTQTEAILQCYRRIAAFSDKRWHHNN